MRRLALILLAGLPAAAAAQPSPSSIASVTCAALTAEGAANPASLLAAMHGMVAARARKPILSEATLAAMRDAIPAGCAGQPDRRIFDLVAPIAAPDPAPLDFATLTCAQLAPLWRTRARAIVPFLAAYLEGDDVSRREMDAVANRVQQACRDERNADGIVLDLARG
jgi:hypothetical protein